jgi:hypothetical protein
MKSSRNSARLTDRRKTTDVKISKKDHAGRFGEVNVLICFAVYFVINVIM